MSKRTRFVASLSAVIARMGGAHLTREARRRTAERFAEVMYSQGYTHFACPENIGGRHLRTYVAIRLECRVETRTLQNELSHLRSILKACGSFGLASAKELSNRALGVAGGSRTGTKTAMTDVQLAAVRELANRQGRPGIASLVTLERHLGLRGAEAIHARSDTLARWEREILADGRVNVIAGTKGGKPRIVQLMHIEPALSALAEARRIADRQESFLVIRANGDQAGGLKQARCIYHAWCHRAGIQPHAARYAFAQGQIKARIDAGFSEREALIATSHDLGHGDGRGRWIKSVYAQ